MKKKDFVSYLMAHGQAFAVAFILILSLSISLAVFLVVVLAAAWLNNLLR